MRDWIRNQVLQGNYQLKLHAAERASLRGIDPLEIREALLHGEIIETYPDDPRGESCLVYGQTLSGRDLHVVCGLASTTLWVMTVYEPDPTAWSDPRTRRTTA